MQFFSISSQNSKILKNLTLCNFVLKDKYLIGKSKVDLCRAHTALLLQAFIQFCLEHESHSGAS